MDFRSINMCGTFGIVTTVSYLTKFVVLRLLIQISCPSAYELSVDCPRCLPRSLSHNASTTLAGGIEFRYCDTKLRTPTAQAISGTWRSSSDPLAVFSNSKLYVENTWITFFCMNWNLWLVDRLWWVDYLETWIWVASTLARTVTVATRTALSNITFEPSNLIDLERMWSRMRSVLLY